MLTRSRFQRGKAQLIKFRTDNLVGFGLSEENIERLKKGDPILFSAADVGGLQGIERVAIFYGKDEDEMQEMMRPYFELSSDSKVIRGKPGESW